MYEGGRNCLLNPPLDTAIKTGDRIILIAEDDVRQIPDFNYAAKINAGGISKSYSYTQEPDRIIVMGWNKTADEIIRELCNYLVEGSEIIIVTDLGEDELRNQLALDAGAVALRFIPGDISQRKFLNSLPLGMIDHIIVIPYTDAMDMQNADALTLTCLLHLRDLSVVNGFTYSIVSEIMDIRNRKLIEVEKIDDFVVSDKLVSLILAQIAENKGIAEIFTILLNPSGVEIYLKPAPRYVTPGEETNYFTIIESAIQKNEIAIGYRIGGESNDPEKNHGIHINPDKSSRAVLGKDDSVIVISDG